MQIYSTLHLPGHRCMPSLNSRFERLSFYLGSISHAPHLRLVSLTVGLGCVVTLVNNQILRPVIVLTAEVRFQDVLHTGSVALLGIEGGTRHVWYGGVSAAPVHVLGVAEWVVLWCWLWEPNITTVSSKLARLEGFGDVFLDDDGTTCGVDEP